MCSMSMAEIATREAASKQYAGRAQTDDTRQASEHE